jgi:outer membrane lipoprotein carrier protein
MLQRLFLFLLLALPGAASPAAVEADADAAARLAQVLAGIGHLQGAFAQRQFAEDGSELGLSTGRFKLLQPGFFSWDIQSPDSQLVVAGPEFIWHYDRDLETVTRRPVAGEAALSPLQVLGGEAGAIEDHYTVAYGDNPGEFLLQPLAPEAGFSSLVLTFDGGAIRRLSFVDNLGQRVEVELSDLDAGTALTPADFSFTPPQGADLFYHDQ